MSFMFFILFIAGIRVCSPPPPIFFMIHTKRQNYPEQEIDYPSNKKVFVGVSTFLLMSSKPTSKTSKKRSRGPEEEDGSEDNRLSSNDTVSSSRFDISERLSFQIQCLQLSIQISQFEQ